MSDKGEKPAVIQVPSLPLLVAVLALVLLPAAAVIVANGTPGFRAAIRAPEPEDKGVAAKETPQGPAAPKKAAAHPALLVLEPRGDVFDMRDAREKVRMVRAGLAGDVDVIQGPAAPEKAEAAAEAARKEKADHALTLHVVFRNNTTHTWQLVEAASGKVVWSRAFVHTKDNADEVTEVGGAVRRVLGIGPPKRAATPAASTAQEVLKLLRPELEKLAPPKADPAVFAAEVLKVVRPEIARAAAPPVKAHRLPSLVCLRLNNAASGGVADMIPAYADAFANTFLKEGVEVAAVVGGLSPRSVPEMAEAARKVPSDFALGQLTTFRDGDRSIIWNLSLVEAASGKLIWSRSFEVTLNRDTAKGELERATLKAMEAVRRALVVPAERQPEPAAPPMADALAVLPFTAGDPVKDAVAKWVDEIPAAVPRGGAARLVPPRRVRAIGAAGDPIAAGKALRARHVLHGEVKAEGKSITVEARLIDAEDDLILWSERYNAAEEADPAAYLRKTGEDIAAAVEKRLSAIRKR